MSSPLIGRMIYVLAFSSGDLTLVWSTNIALQLKEYCVTSFHYGNTYKPTVFEALRNAFIMATQSDGKNGCQLEWARLGLFVDQFVRERPWVNATEENGWSADDDQK